MKLFLFVALSFFAVSCSAVAAPQPEPSPGITLPPIPPIVDVPPTVNLHVAWDLETDPQVTGYRVYYSLTSHGQTIGSGWACQVDAVTNNCILTNVPTMVTHYFVATALNANQTDPSLAESDPSAELAYKYPSPLPTSSSFLSIKRVP